MKKSLLLFVFPIFFIFLPRNVFACDESSAILTSTTDNGNGTFTYVLDVCVEYLGLEGSPDSWSFTFTGATVNSFSPASVTTGTGDVYTGSGMGTTILTYATAEIFPSHTSTTFCNTYTITTSAEATSLVVNTHDGYPSNACSHTFTFCLADAGTLSVDINGIPQGNAPYNVPDGQTITFTSNNNYVPPPPAGTDPAGIAYAVFSCDPSGLDLNNPNTYTNPGVNPNCFEGFDFNLTTSDTNNGGVSTAPAGFTNLWLVVVTVDDADCNGQSPCNGGIDLNGDGCVAHSGPFEIIYDPPNTPSPCNCGVSAACGGAHFDTACEAEEDYNNLSSFMAGYDFIPDLNGANGTTYELCYEYTTGADETTIGFVNAVGTVDLSNPAGCTFTRNYFVYETSNCGTPIPNVGNSSFGNGFIYDVNPNTSYNFCVEITINDTDCSYIDNTFVWLYQEPSCDATCADPCNAYDRGQVGNFPTYQECDPFCVPFFNNIPSTVFTRCYEVQADGNGTLGIIQQFATTNGALCAGSIGGSRMASLYPSGNCSGSPIPPTTANGGNSSTFNPEWTGLTPNGLYVVCIETEVDDICDYLGGCLDFYGFPCVTPNTPVVSGNNSLCQNTSGEIYSISAVSGATGYTWTITGGTITQDNGTSVTVTWASSGSGTLCVTADNNCGSSTPDCFNVTINAPTSPTLGSASICDDNGLYDLTQLEDPGFPNGNWTGPGVAGNNFNPTGQNGSVTLTFTPTGTCESSSTTTINVTASSSPTLGNASICDDNGLYDLTQLEDPSFPNGNWTGPGVAGNNFNPTGQSGSVTLTFTPTGTCESSSTTTINVTASSSPTLGNASICDDNGLYDLTQLEDPSFPNGNWTGPGVAGNNFNPTGQSGSVTLTFTPTGTCESSSTTTINVTASSSPTLGNASICDDNGLYDLTQLEDPSFPNGNWTGPGVAGNNFNPTGQSGSVTLTFTPTGNCESSSTTTINVTASSSPTLGNASICDDNGLYDLTQLEDPSFPNGSWTGPGVAGNNFNPTGQNGSVTLTFTPTGTCESSSTTTINVTASSSPTLGNASICDDNGLYDLTQLEDPSFPNGNWTGPGVAGNNFNPTGQSGSVTLTFTPSGTCESSSTTTINVTASSSPTLGNASICDDNGLYDLTQLEDPGFPNGSWTGPGVAGNNFNPTGQSGSVTLTFTPTGTCESPSTTTINVTASSSPTLGNASMCDDNGLYDLTQLEDPSFPNGNWTGPGVAGNNFNPTGQSGSVTLTFTPTGNCESSSTTTINVTASSSPTLGNASICDDNGLYDLTQLEDPGFPNGSWTGPGVTGNNFNPTGQNGSVTLTFTPSGTCESSSTTTINVTASSSPTLGNASICDDNGLYDLTQLEDPSFPNGNWTGPGVAGNNFNPTGQSGSVTLTFTPTGNCESSSTTTINVTASSSPTLGNASICDDNGLYDLTQLEDPGFPNGSWTGPGVTGNNFNPAGQSGSVTLTFTPTGTCESSSTTTINVTASSSPTLGNASICDDNGLYDLTQLEDPSFPNGNWTGPGVAGNNFNPTGQSGSVTLTFTPTGTCESSSTTTINVNPIPIASIAGSTSICEGSSTTITFSLQGTGPFNVIYQDDQSNQFPLNNISNGHVISVSPSSNTTYSLVAVSDGNSPSCTGTVSGNAMITVSEAPTVSNIIPTCNGTNTAYTVSFEINGGDPSSYVVSGGTGTLSGNVFISDEIPSGTPYNFQVDDINGCGPTIVSGTFNCTCTTAAGTMDLSPIEVCEDQTAIAIHNGNEVLDANDILQFVLHDASGASLGNIISLNSLPEFTFQSGMTYGTTYYISAIAGNDIAGNVELTDPCLSVAQGTPVVFNPLPTAVISGDASICQGESIALTFNLTGNGPFNVTYLTDGGNPIILNNIVDGHVETVFPVGNSLYTLSGITDNSSPSCSGNVSGSASVTINDAPGAAVQSEICNSTNTGYVVTIQISGGDPSSYTVSGNTGTLSGNMFTSDEVASGDPYTFQIDDANGCGPTIISGSFNCACATSAGTMDLTPIAVCENEQVTALHNGNENLDGDDLLQFVLHDGNGTSLGNIFSTNNTPEFNFQAGMMTGVTYYISAIAGNNVGGNVDLTDPCLSVAQGTPVVFTENPEAGISGDITICQGEDAFLTFNFSTGGPFDIIYLTNGTNPISLNNITDGFVETVSPSATAVYTIQSVTDLSNPGCVVTINGSATVTVTSAGMPSLGTASLCDDNGLYDLTGLQDPNYPTGTWSGDGVSGNNFDPTGWSGDVTLTFTPSGNCNLPATTIITVTATVAPNLGTATICENNGVFDLTTLEDMNFPIGAWSGNGVNGSDFDPTGLSGDVTLTFTPSGNCELAATTTISITPTITPNLGTATICENNGVFDLTTLEDMNFPTGNWSGDGVSGSDFDPTGLSGDVTLTFTPSGNCELPSSTIITLNAIPEASISGTSIICNGATATLTFNFLENGPFDIIYQDDNNNQFPLNNILDGHTIDISPMGNTIFTLVSVMDGNSPACEGTVSGTAMVTVNEAPTVSNIQTICNASNTGYTISFEINGGDASSYEVTGGSGTLTGNVFVSDEIASGTPYNFTADDGNGCDPVDVSGSFDCACTTFAGTMDLNLMALCDGATAIATHNGDEVFDGDDMMEFVLHDGNGNSLGNIISTNNIPEFGFQMGMTYGTTYYISSVVGNDIGGSVDLADPCLSVSQGTPVVWNELPTAMITGDASICAGESTDLAFTLTGNGPFEVVWSDGSPTPITLSNISNGHIETVFPNVNTTYTLVSISDSSNPNCVGTVSGTAMVTVNEAPTVSNIQTICNASNTGYTISFEINGGDASSYEVTGGSGALTGNVFVSDELASGTPYNFTADDGNGCDPVDVSGSFDCACTTFAGTMDLNLMALCDGATAIATHNGDEVFDGDDMMEFVLHDGNGNSLGNIISTNDTSEFGFQGGMTYGTTYYISSVVGNDVGGSVDLADPCLSVSQGTPVVWNELPTAVITGDATICVGESTDLIFTMTGNGPFEVVMSDGSPTPITLSNISNGHIETIFLNENTTYTLVSISDSSNPTCVGTVSGMAMVTVNEAPTVSNIQTICNASNTGYTVSFEINGGDAASYQVTGGSGTLTGNVFVSDEIASGTAYNFTADDANGCDPVDVSGSFDCACTTFAGTMDLNLMALCDGATAIATHNGDEVFDGDDMMEFVLHDGNGNSLGNIISTNNIPEFGFQGGMTYGTTYYISSVVGNDVGGIVDLADPCLSVSQGTPVVWNELPSAVITGDATICGGEPSELTFSLTGTGPFNVVYQLSDGTQVTLNNILNNHMETVFPNDNETYTIVSVTDNGTSCGNTVSSTASIEVILSPLSILNLTEFCDASNMNYTVSFEITGGDPNTYVVTNGSGSISGNIFTSTPLPSGTPYSFTIDDVNGCSPLELSGVFECACQGFDFSIEITSENNGFGLSCSDANDGSVEIINITGGNAPYNVVWSNNQTGMIADNLSAGNYSVTITDADGCTEIGSVTLTAPAPLIAEWNIGNISCFGFTDGEIIIENVTGGTGPYLFSINNSPFGDNDAFTNLSEGTYSIIIQDANGCETTIESTLSEPAPLTVNAGLDTLIYLGNSIQLFAMPSILAIDSVVWTPSNWMNCNNCLDPILTPLSTQTYEVTVFDGNGCFATDKVMVEVGKNHDVYIPNAFSPNDDGRNDAFTVFAGDNVVEVKVLRVFDRWGDTIFENKNFQPNDLSVGWDGFFRGKLMNTAVFVYFAEIEFIDGEVEIFKGDVTIMK